MLDSLNQLDHQAFYAINGLAGHISGVDRLIAFVRDSEIAKGVFVMMIWWGLWFYRDSRANQDRERLLAVLVVSVVTIFVGRLLALILPFRERPLHDAAIEVIIPSGAGAQTLMGWSSFPSDHAVLFFALATGIFLVNRIMGVVLLIHAVMIISLPRIYTGIHFPGDILFGALIGISVTLLLFRGVTALAYRFNIVSLADRRRYIFYPILFFITFQAASMFTSSRELAEFLYRAARALAT